MCIRDSISYGELFFTGSKDDFVDMFRVVKGGIEELSDDLKNKAAGCLLYTSDLYFAKFSIRLGHSGH